MSVLDVLLEQLDLEQIETNLFRGISTTMGGPRVFGGQVIGQALIAASRTVEDRLCHSLHGYFLRPGDPSLPIVYDVDRIRDGKSFTTRRVVAIQKGEAIFNMAASFQVHEEGLSHQFDMPDVPPPEECQDESAAWQTRLAEMPEEMQRMARERPIEMRRVEPFNMMNPQKRPPYQHAWLRASSPLPDDAALHQCILAYASDMGILSTCTLPHGKSFMSGLMTASLDHAMWFHRPFRVDEWILFAQDSPVSGGSRGFNRGTMFTRDGTLIASVAQEGLIRLVTR
ncbi:MAG TPA: acyl-CoA thioesterase II [Pseudomonadales bacterium]|nr:acyl-CoA thioesterase II [Pseudomonadales bacterium]